MYRGIASNITSFYTLQYQKHIYVKLRFYQIRKIKYIKGFTMSQLKFWWNLLTKFRKRADKLYSQKKSWADSNDFWTIVKCEIGCSDRLNDVDTLEFLSSSIWIYRHCLLYRINYFGLRYLSMVNIVKLYFDILSIMGPIRL